MSWSLKKAELIGWVVLLYSGIGSYQCAVGPFVGENAEEKAKEWAREKGGRMPAIVPIYSIPLE
jgi:hypothetical protein